MRRLLLFSSLLVLNYSHSQGTPFDFGDSKFVVLSDADIVASGLVDGILKNHSKIKDSLSVITLNSGIKKVDIQRINVNSSVTIKGKTLALSNNQKVAFVVENRREIDRRLPRLRNLDNMTYGRLIYAIDIQEKPKILDSLEVGIVPESISINNITNELLVVSRDTVNTITIADWNRDHFGKSISYSTRNLSSVTHGLWHPTGLFFALVTNQQTELVFYKYINGEMSEFGEFVLGFDEINDIDFVGNGNHVLVSENRGNGIVKGQLKSVLFDINGQHRVIDSISIGIGPKTLAYEPNEGLVAVSNSGTTYYPISHSLFGIKPSIGLYKIDKSTGKLSLLDEKIWNGVLPRDIEFNSQGTMLCITSFNYLDLSRIHGGLHFWEIKSNSDGYELLDSGFKITLTRGSFAVSVVEN